MCWGEQDVFYLVRKAGMWRVHSVGQVHHTKQALFHVKREVEKTRSRARGRSWSFSTAGSWRSPPSPVTVGTPVSARPNTMRAADRTAAARHRAHSCRKTLSIARSSHSRMWFWNRFSWHKTTTEKFQFAMLPWAEPTEQIIWNLYWWGATSKM